MSLSRQNWPVDPGGKDAFYGRPASANDAAWQAQNLVPYPVPWTGHSVMVHAKVRASLDRVLTEYWAEISRDQSVIDKYGLADVETYAYRANRNNPSVLSNHSYGIAVDLAPSHQPNGTHWQDGGTMMPRRLIELFKFEGWRWGGDFGGTADPMHFEAVHDQHHDQPPVPAPQSIDAPMAVPPAVQPTPTLPVEGLILDQITGWAVARSGIPSQLADVKAKLQALLQEVDGIIGTPAAPVGKSPVALPPLGLPGLPLPPFLNPQPSAAPAQPVQKAIIATVFGGASDPNKSAYDGHQITDSEIGCALPMRFAGSRPMVCIVGPGGTAIVPIIDVGPIYPSNRGPADPYWQTDARPRAEINHILSQAGIDLTPATARAVGVDGKGKVDWYFATQPKGAATMNPVTSSPVTSGVGGTAIVAAIADLVLAYVTKDASRVGTDIFAIVSGVGLLFAKDFNTSGGTK